MASPDTQQPLLRWIYEQVFYRLRCETGLMDLHDVAARLKTIYLSKQLLVSFHAICAYSNNMADTFIAEPAVVKTLSFPFPAVHFV